VGPHTSGSRWPAGHDAGDFRGGACRRLPGRSPPPDAGRRMGLSAESSCTTCQRYSWQGSECFFFGTNENFVILSP
jgi:hypothetical protein